MAKSISDHKCVYHGFTFRWSLLPNMQEHRAAFSIGWADDGRLFAIGGQTGPDKITDTVEMLNASIVDAANDMANARWSFVASLQSKEIACSRLHWREISGGRRRKGT